MSYKKNKKKLHYFIPKTKLPPIRTVSEYTEQNVIIYVQNQKLKTRKKYKTTMKFYNEVKKSPKKSPKKLPYICNNKKKKKIIDCSYYDESFDDSIFYNEYLYNQKLPKIHIVRRGSDINNTSIK